MHPEWSYTANIYEVNVRQYTREGTFVAFAEHLPRLRDMGVKILWFMPIHPISKEGRLGSLGSYYAIADYYGINPEFGTLEDFKSLVKKAHSMHFKVIIDYVANHTGNDHPWIKSHPDYFIYDKNGEVLHPHGWSDVAQLNYHNPEVHQEMIKVLEYWVKECDLDGYRCDMAHLVPLDFWVEAKRVLSAQKKDLFWLAECEVPQYHKVFDATYTWQWMHASEQFYKGEMNLHSLQTVLYKSVTEFPGDAFRAYFTSNHDENSWNGTEYEKYGDAAALFAVFACTWNGIPLLYSGQELPNKKRLKFFDKDQIDWTDDIELHQFYKTLLTLRTNNEALCPGRDDVFTRIIAHPEDPEIFSYLRSHDEDAVLIVLNCSNQSKQFQVKQLDGMYRNVFGGPDINLSNSPSVFVERWGYLVFEKIKFFKVPANNQAD